MSWADHADWLLLGSLLVLPLVGWVLWRLGAWAFAWLRDAAFLRAAAVLESFRATDFADTDRLVSRLRALRRTPAVDEAVNRELNFVRGLQRERLVTVSRELGLVARHLRRLREASDWVARAESAYALGRHRVVEAIPVLVECLRDPEEARNVKVAAAQALLLMRSAEAVPVLVRQLVADDDWASPLIAELLEHLGASALPAMLEALGDEAMGGGRVWLARILGQSGRKETAELLAAHLSDPADFVRVAVAEALGRLGAPAALGPLVEAALRDPLEHVRVEAARAMARIGENLALPRLTLRLADSDYALRIRAIDALQALQPQDLACLHAPLDDPSAEVRLRAAKALEQLGAVDDAVDQLAANDPVSVENARAFLGKVARAGLAEALGPYVAHSSPRVRARLAELLGEAGDNRMAGAVETLLADPVDAVRAAAAMAIGQLRPRRGLKHLVGALGGDDAAVLASAAGALRSLELPENDEEVVTLTRLFGRANTDVRLAIVESVGGMARLEVDDLLRRAVADVDPNVRLEAVRRAAERADESWFTVLAEALSDADTRVRAAAARGLGRVGSAAALAQLVKHIDTPDRELREALSDALVPFGPNAFARLVERSATPEGKLALVWTLGKMTSSGAVERLAKLADDDDPALRAAVAGALGRHPQSNEAEALLKRLLTDPNARVRAASANALSRRSPTQALAETLAQAVSDPDTFVRSRAALALGQMGGDLAIETLQTALFGAEDPDELAHVAVGLVLTTSHAGLAAALRVLEDEHVENDVRSLLAEEEAGLRERFRRSLRLELSGEARPGTGLTAHDLPENYVHALQNSRWVAARASAVSALRSMGILRYRDLVVNALRTDPAPEVRLMALEALTDLHDDEQLADWCALALSDRDLHVKIKAATGLTGRCRPAHFEALLRGFEAKSPDLDGAVIRALSTVSPDDVPALLAAMGQITDPTVRAGAAATLSALGDERAVPLLAEWLRSPHRQVREEATRTLAELPSPESRRALVATLDRANPELAIEVLDALPNLVDLDSLESLMALAGHSSVEVRRALARAAGRGPYPKGVELTERLCWDELSEVRVEAMLTLLFVRDSEALERFTVIVRRQPSAVRQALKRQPSLRLALVSLHSLAGAHRDKAVRAAAIGAMAAVDDRPRTLLVRALNDPAREVRVAAAAALGDLDVPEIQAALRRLRDDPNEAVRSAAETQQIRVPNPRHTPAPGWEIIRLPKRSRRRQREG